MAKWIECLITIWGMGLMFMAGQGLRAQDAPQDFAKMSLEDLMNVEVTSVSKKQQKISQVASAIYVISQEDIRQSGGTNIPDLLRMVPGLDVAQINGNTWAISSRGFNTQYAFQLLVLIDGRTVYSPLSSGVYWDVQEVPLIDIDRIEVIRGPGATIWGSNAVNGVINIITKTAQDTQGGTVTAGGGNVDQARGTIQYGSGIRGLGAYRIFADYMNRGDDPGFGGPVGNDGSVLYRTGFRIDSPRSSKDRLTVEGDLYHGSDDSEFAVYNPASFVPQLVRDCQPLSGGDILARWTRTFSPNSETTLQVYFDRALQTDVTMSDQVNTYDADFQHHLGWGSRQDIVWGLGCRYTSDDTHGDFTTSLVPAALGRTVVNGFAQDEIALKPDRVSLTLGSKIEHNDYTGFEFEPSVRLGWNANERNMFWVSSSIAYTLPGRDLTSLRTVRGSFPGPAGLPGFAVLMGNPDMPAERLHAIETGYRTQIRKRLSLDLALYYDRYGNVFASRQQALTAGGDSTHPYLVLPILFGATSRGDTSGAEVAVNWAVVPRWTLNTGYTTLAIPTLLNGNSPRHQAQLRSGVRLSPRINWNASAYFVDRLQASQVPAYTRLDTSLNWQVGEGLALTLAGQNLLQDRHLEFNDGWQSVFSTLVKRSVYARIAWQF